MIEAKKPFERPFIPNEISLLNFVVANYTPIPPDLLA
jgi:hypothetical protein